MKEDQAIKHLKGIIDYMQRTIDLDALNVFNDDDIQPSAESRAQNIIDFAMDLIKEAKDIKENIER